ncbi:MAG: Tetraacyldisaccharide 4'-kinase [Candidatus Erwinia impunctatus]|nr:Tetraacyldisaccharide 4'-kinase [Culicoides impunctatus]
MIEKMWSGRSFLYWLLLPLSLVYGAVSTLIRYSYQWKWRKRGYFPLPVVIVGNLTAGGNGKTPFVIWLVGELLKRGYRPAVVSRGYGGNAPYYPLLITESTSAAECGDEPLLIARRTGVPVAVSPDRCQAVKTLLQNRDIDIIIADDGLQHYALARDLEIVVVDGVRRFGNGWWLPAGPMRERASRLNSVDAVINNGGEPHPGEIPMRLQPGKAVNIKTGEVRAVSALQHVVAMAGIGHPQRFFNTLSELGVIPEQQIAFNDHAPYTELQLTTLVNQHQVLLMTEKDAVKVSPFAADNWWYLPVDADITGTAAEALIERISDLIRP